MFHACFPADGSDTAHNLYSTPFVDVNLTIKMFLQANSVIIFLATITLLGLTLQLSWRNILTSGLYDLLPHGL
jgi:hypothetical protein